MTLLDGIDKDETENYAVYYVEYISEELKNAIRTRLSAICHGTDPSRSKYTQYSYKATAKEFIKRYQSANNASEDRKKGMIGELLVHIIVNIEGKYTPASPFLNMEERSFRKGYDLVMYDSDTDELWINEVKSGNKQKAQKDSSAAAVGLINTAKNDLNRRLNEQNTAIWLNAANAARVSMSNSSNQKDMILNLIDQYGEAATAGQIKSEEFNVILSGNLFHPLGEKVDIKRIENKYNRVVNEKLFKKVYVVTIQKETYQAIYDFLESEANS